MSETTFQQFIQDFENYLIYQRDQGVKTLEIDHALLAELGKMPEVERQTNVASVVPDKPIEQKPIPEFSTMDEIATHISGCQNCPLCQNRTHTVPGEGNANCPDVMFIGEGPGADEDAQGRPFVGKAGQLLTKMIEAMGYKREEVFIANIVKCRPPGNRAPLPEEMSACLPYLKQQIGIIRPRAIVALGGTSIKGLLGKTAGITRIRGQWQTYEGIDLMPTFHPSYLLRDPSQKKLVWEDLKSVLKHFGKEPPPR